MYKTLYLKALHIRAHKRTIGRYSSAEGSAITTVLYFVENWWFWAKFTAAFFDKKDSSIIYREYAMRRDKESKFA